MVCTVIDSFTETIFKIPVLWIFTGRDLGLIRFLFFYLIESFILFYFFFFGIASGANVFNTKC